MKLKSVVLVNLSHQAFCWAAPTCCQGRKDEQGPVPVLPDPLFEHEGPDKGINTYIARQEMMRSFQERALPSTGTPDKSPQGCTAMVYRRAMVFERSLEGHR